MNQAKVHQFQKENNWDGIADMILDAGRRLEKAGATQVMFCANTPHKIYDKVAAELELPILHIADATAQNIKKEGLKKVGFLGTKYTMTEDFITKRIADQGIEVLTPLKKEVIEELHRIIIDELTYGRILPESKKYVLDVIHSFIDQGATGVILGCTEFPLMIDDKDLDISVFNTTIIHADAAVKYILKDINN